MITRSATEADLPALTELQRRVDTAWFGAPEHDEDEVREELMMINSLEQDSRLIVDGERIVAAAFRRRTESSLLVDPDYAATAIYDDLLDWVAAGDSPRLEALDRDDHLRTALIARNWRYAYSSFELIRPAAELHLDAPSWATGVELRDYRPDNAAALYQLIYDRARWTDVPGHDDRGFDEWHGIFLDGRESGAEAPVLAWRDDLMIGAAIGRMFSDGTGWVAQLAVDPAEQRRGIGTALLLESFGRRIADGATALGLGVSAANRSALRLYESIGLVIDREWQLFRAPREDAN